MTFRELLYRFTDTSPSQDRSLLKAADNTRPSRRRAEASALSKTLADTIAMRRAAYKAGRKRSVAGEENPPAVLALVQDKPEPMPPLNPVKGSGQHRKKNSGSIPKKYRHAEKKEIKKDTKENAKDDIKDVNNDNNKKAKDTGTLGVADLGALPKSTPEEDLHLNAKQLVKLE